MTSPPIKRGRPTDATPTTKQAPHTAVLMDAGAVFFAIRDLYEGHQLNYETLSTELCSQLPPLLPPHKGNDKWVMWTSVVAHNPGQVRFLQFAERNLGWTVRRFSPTEGYVVDPIATFGLASDSRTKDRLLRYDATIAFAMGRLASDHRIVLLSDSFALAEPLVRASRTTNCRNAVAFFGRLLDPRWQRVFQAYPIDFIDLGEEEVANRLFGFNRSSERTSTEESAFDDAFLTK